MRIRKRSLPSGWYPADERSVRQKVQEYLASSPEPEKQSAMAGIVPHAGWDFSGALACEVFRRIRQSVRTVVVVGGHLGPEDGILGAMEDGYDTPLGVLEADRELLEALRERIRVDPDRAPDNTVEIQLPILKALLPGVRALALRAPPARQALDLGRELASLQDSLGARIAVVGSTDLTHYGPNYGFLSAGHGEQARKWVEETNDRRFVESLISMDLEEAIRRSIAERSACSAGGAVAAAGFAQACGITGGTLIRYTTSLEVHPSQSFVGYAAIVYAKDA
jgi:MEMO1 family protein